MHGRVKKTLCQKILDELTDKSILKCKEYGKSKIYLANQDNFPTTSKEELLMFDEKIKLKKEALQALQARLKDIQASMDLQDNSDDNRAQRDK